ncbi:MAG TPA: carotenoid oxygenase family protein [Actinocrinis sp.]|nr:carotenoid oxygenase family protein [Actinocrinis sp.]
MSAQPESTPHHSAGGYRPVADEVTVLRPEVRGALPPELDGSFLRIGPNPLGRTDPSRHNALTGDPMVHGLRLRDGRAQWYRNRWVRTDRAVRTLGGLPTPGPRHGLSEECNGNLLRHAGRTYAVGDGGVLPVELDRELATVARGDFDGTLPGGFSAHPELDPVTGELYAVAYQHDLPYLHYLTIGVDGRVRRAEPIATKSTSMMHAFSITDRHAVIYDLPVVFDPQAATAGSRLPYTWDDGHGARIGVLPRNGGDADVLWMDVDPCYVFHALNAYESGRWLVLDVVRHQRLFDRDRLRASESAPSLWRWTVDLLAGTVTEEQIDDQCEEFPRLDDRFKGTRHRYGFAVGMRPGDGGALAGPALLRHDLDTRRTERHEFGPGRETGEAVFVPRAADAPEGDGWLLSLVYDKSTDRSELSVLDTADFTGEPVATVPLPVRVPHGFHASWIGGS